jgi:hypothetical protein
MPVHGALVAVVLIGTLWVASPVAAQGKVVSASPDERAAIASPTSVATPATTDQRTATPATQGKQTTKQSDDDQPVTPASESLPVDLVHIRDQVDHLPAIKLDESQLRFYTLVLARQPSFNDFIGDYDLKNGPTKGGAAMTHQEFVDMVTPKELNQLLGGTNGGALMMLQWAAVNAVGQSLIKKAIQDLRGARDDHDVQAIRERINQELQALLAKDDKNDKDPIR